MLGRLIFTLLILSLIGRVGYSGTAIPKPGNDSTEVEKNIVTKQNSGKRFSYSLIPKITLFQKNEVSVKHKSKVVAGLLALTLGPFGVHRLYLGTSPKVPIAYTLTLGGGFFVLPLIDIVYIIVSQNMEDIENNNHVFIWNKKRASKKP